MSRVPGKIIQIHGKTDLSYTVGTQFGVLKTKFRAGDMQDYSGEVICETSNEIILRLCAMKMNGDRPANLC